MEYYKAAWFCSEGSNCLHILDARVAVAHSVLGNLVNQGQVTIIVCLNPAFLCFISSTPGKSPAYSVYFTS